MKKSIIALSIIALTFSMGASARPERPDRPDSGNWNKNYQVDHRFTEKFDVELLGFIPQKCKADFDAERELKHHNNATYVDLKNLQAQKVGKLTVDCNLPKTSVSVRPKYHLGKFVNTKFPFENTSYDLSFDKNGEFGRTASKTEFKDWNIKKDLWIKVEETPKVHGIYKTALVIDVESKFY